ncbi:DUF559 domain-containing protein [Lyngbya sp. CCY1209]|uniref:DUF559 domain-containing protein n=1 Tax=Lyngbya sp. CCY1209 TaxID=2886103 RepID=UPI002D208A23|nr:DUF559 domain-containing protein [Lyngbya sp. CCY1209]MEB3885612.1 DUF559 domain-containing protein [Lyngbya sp. CCY1209]
MANLSGLQIEGNLIVSDLTSDLLAGDIKGQAAEDFGLGKSDKLADEIAIAWGDAKAYWAAFRRAFSRLPEGDAATTATREQWVVPLLRSLGYDPVYVAKAEVVEGLTYAISHRAEPGADKPPVHIVGAGVRLEERPPSGTPRLSAHALVQEYLNRTEHLWAVVTNGLRWRLLRDSSLMTRLSYIEFDLEQILDGENFAEFGLFYRLFHRSRLPRDADDADRCLLEFYHQESLQQGGRVRDRLRDGVERALVLLGTGFLQWPSSPSPFSLGEKGDKSSLSSGLSGPSSPNPFSLGEKGNQSEEKGNNKLLPPLAPRERGPGGEGATTFYRLLLRLIYRLLFLMVAESRGALLAGSDAEKARIYTEYYSIERLRTIAEKPSYRREGYQDLWQGLRVTFALFDENWRGRLLDLSPLNGDLFGSESLAELDEYAIDNHDLKTAIWHLSMYENKGQWRRVNYGALDVEELGSVYESLLDFNPKIECKSGIYYFRLVTGSDRKTTGSYYTPPALVGQLIESALEPVIAQRLQSVGPSSPSPFSLGEKGDKSSLSSGSSGPSSPNPFSLGEKGDQSEEEGNNKLLPPLAPRERGSGGEGKWEIPPHLQKRMLEIARQFRKEPTPSEAILWQALRRRQLENRKFRRQHPIGTFIVDFFCWQERLIVEVDGPIHERQREADRQRQELLESLGLHFVRVTSEEVENNLPKVLETIKQSFGLLGPLEPSEPSSPSPFSLGEKGDKSSLSLGSLGPSSPNPFSLGEKGDKSSLSSESLGPSSPNPFSLGEKGNQSEEEGNNKLLPPLAPRERGLGGEGEAALLSLKICDPACGSGHFLLAAARRLGKELARVRTGEAQPGPEPLRQAIRDVIQHCIYGVDLNPLAVDLCKVALWIEGFCRGLPLNFLDHRIKCGNSLVGVLDVDCLDEGIPDAAFKAMTGDDKKVVASFKKRNKQELKDIETGQLSLVFEDPKSAGRQEYAKEYQALGESPETTTDEVKRKAEEYQLLHSPDNLKWWRDRTACNLWTAAFFTPLTLQNLQLIPTSATLHRVLEGATAEELTREGTALFAIIDAANRVADSYRFFHWAIEFPDVFENGGFDCVLGNPPWEQLQIAEKEFFAGKDDTIVSAKTSVARKKLIAKLPQENPQLAKAWADAKYFADAQNKFIRESRRFPLTATGKINTYAVFSETARNLISDSGYAGIIVPTGIATDATCQHFFGDLVKKKSLKTLFDFENRRKLFSDVDSRMKFALLVIGQVEINTTDFSFFLLEPNQVNDLSRKFELQPEDIQLMNPNTLTCPIFRTRTDAELTKKIYRRVPVLENEQTGENPWGISFMQGLFNMSSDSGLFYDEPGSDRLPLYEAKMFWQFDHRHGTYQGDKTENLSIEDKQNPDYSVTPRYWVDRTEVENKLGDRWDKEWLMALRKTCRSTDERTSILSLVPRFGINDKSPLIFVGSENIPKTPCFLGNINSIVFDFITRQKLGGIDFSFFILKQLPIIPPDWYTPEDIEYISSRVLELVYTTHDMKPFAADMGYSGEPFIWDENRRAILKAELDAKYARLYGLTRDELRYILDPADIHGDDFPSETFRVLKNNEMKAYGEYRTRRLVLEAWDRLG